ncbi:MAG TPA: nucleotidyltransferase family protein [Candidatus Dormibacteraeota bacterium]|jgi:molybdenum cofactor cytidylyltransferase|nr:nucleotidyltransferase family protein [Candidatus Dormibacteraeota bacterium]
MTAVAIVPAAGAAERFGGRKLLADVDGEPLIARTLSALLSHVAAAVVIVGPDATELRALPALRQPKVRLIENADPSRGMLSSIQAGLATVDWADAYLVIPGDMPFVRASTVGEIVERQACTSGGIVSPRYRGKRGHPVALPSRLRGEVLAEDVAHTLHDVIRRHLAEREDLEVDDPGVIRDVDTMDDIRR